MVCRNLCGEVCLRLLRHRSLQYFTSSQLRAHFLRQLKGLPQVSHGLEGRKDLFPGCFMYALQLRQSGCSSIYGFYLAILFANKVQLFIFQVICNRQFAVTTYRLYIKTVE